MASDAKMGDITITLKWNSGGPDLDLHCKVPAGQEIYYSQYRKVSSRAKWVPAFPKLDQRRGFMLNPGDLPAQCDISDLDEFSCPSDSNGG